MEFHIFKDEKVWNLTFLRTNVAALFPFLCTFTAIIKALGGMEREAISQLYEWKARENRKPLIIQGARQVGKTWLMMEFAQKAYDKWT